MPNTIFEILIVLALIAANGVFSLSEMAVVSARKIRLQQMAEEGDSGARVALELADAPNRFLSTVQIGITLIGIVSGAYGGATIAGKLAAMVATIAWLEPYSGPLAYIVVVGTITFLSLVVGELVPKRLALGNPERIAAAVATAMSGLSRIAGPAVQLLSLATDGILKVVGIKPASDNAITEEEIRVLIEQGTEAGVFAPAEQELLERVFGFGDRQVSSLMTPRPDIFWLDADSPQEELAHALATSPHSRLPLCRGDLDRVEGIVLVRDVLEQLLAGRELDLTPYIRQPLLVPETIQATRALELFKQSGTPLALVVDEFGSVQGLVTLRDVLEALVGDLPSEEATDEGVVLREDGSWLIDGALSIDELEHLVEPLPELPRGKYGTVGGFAMARLGRIPRVGDHFVWSGFRFEVVDMDGNRVDKVLLSAAPDETGLTPPSGK